MCANKKHTVTMDYIIVAYFACKVFTSIPFFEYYKVLIEFFEMQKSV